MPATAGKLNLINLSKDGTFRASGEYQTLPHEVDAIFEHLRQNQIGHLVMYFHGGLTKEAHGVGVANQLMPLFQERLGAHPVFFVWESGWQEIIKHNLSSITAQPLFKELGEIVLKFALSKLKSLAEGRDALDRLSLVSDAEVATARQRETAGEHLIDPELRAQLAPLSEDQERQLERYLENDLEFQSIAEEIANAVEIPGEAGRGAAPAAGEQADLSWFSDEVVEELKMEIAADPSGRGLISTAFLIKSAVGILKRVVARLIKHTDHGLVCTVTEELLRQFYVDKVGGWLWGEMKNEVKDAFADNSGLSGELLHGGTYFLERLKAYVEDAQHPPLGVSLIGHSAGSIYICQLVEKAAQVMPERFKFDHISTFSSPPWQIIQSVAKLSCFMPCKMTLSPGMQLSP